MKTLLYAWILFVNFHYLQAQNVGINTTSPASTLHVHNGTFGISGLINNTEIMKLYDFQYVPGFQGMLISEDYIPRVFIKDGGKVGIKTLFPSSDLEINGDTNFRGPIKIQGVQGQQGDLLGVNQNGQLAWIPSQSLGGGNDFANWITIPYSGTPVGTWNVPAGVTKICIEMWGGGSGGHSYRGGGGGGYLKAIINVTPGQTISHTVGGPGGGGGGPGGTSSFTLNGQTFSAQGGTAIGGSGSLADPINGGFGGGFAFPLGTPNVYGVQGEDGDPVLFDYAGLSSSNSARVDFGGNGGNVANWPTPTGGKGLSIITGATGVNRHARNSPGRIPGGGGGAGSNSYGGALGGAGLIIIRY